MNRWNEIEQAAVDRHRRDLRAAKETQRLRVARSDDSTTAPSAVRVQLWARLRRAIARAVRARTAAAAERQP